MILLAHTSIKGRIVGQIRKRKITKWLFLCRDYNRLLFFEKIIDGAASRISTASILDSKAKQLRDPVNGLLLKLAEQYHSLEWWSMRLSEKNTLVSNLFLHICYLSIAVDILKEHVNICVVSDSQALLESLHDMYPDSLRIRSFSSIIERIKRIIKPPVYFIFFILQSILRGWEAKMYSRKITRDELDKKKKSILIFTWADERYFGNNGKISDRYFMILPHWLKDNGYEVIIFPKLCNMQKTYKEAYRWFKQSDDKFLLEYNYYHLSDYFYPVKIYLRRKSLRFKFNNLYIGVLKLDRLFSHYNASECLYSDILHYRLVKRIVADGIKPDIYIDFYESMLPQKMFRLGIRKYCPNTKIVTYQHAPLFPNLLCMYMSEKELEYAPDRYICSGQAMMDVMINKGFPKKKLILGPALRFDFLHKIKLCNNKTKNEYYHKTVLVVFPLEKKLAEELIAKSLHCLKGLNKTRVILKVHPMMSKRDIIQFCKVNQWIVPEYFEFSDKEIYSLLEDADCAMLMATTSILEFCVLGLPYINIGSEVALRHDPTEWFDKCNPPLYTEDEIKNELGKILNGSVNRYKPLLREYVFEPVNESSLRAFTV